MLSPESTFDVVSYGEVLWDMLATKSLPGGAPMNVAYHLKKLGHHPALITKVGIDDQGKKLVNFLSAAGLSTDYFQIDYTHTTGRVNAKTHQPQDVLYDIVYPSAWDFIQWEAGYEKLIAGAAYFICGSLTSRNKESRETLYRLLDSARTTILDINLRPPYFDRAGIEYLLRNADIVKLNIHELELLTGWFSRFTGVEDRIASLQDRFQLQTVIVTLGEKGSIAREGGELYGHPGFRVSVADTIGSGDAYLAGFLHQKSKGSPLAQCLNFASALGGLTATYHGACPDYTMSEVNDLLNNNLMARTKTS